MPPQAAPPPRRLHLVEARQIRHFLPSVHEDPGDSETDTEPVNHPATSASGPIRPPASISSRPHRARHPPKNIL
ncbi:hypothetical protein HRG_012154 [Hirsutella rhossiliensis]